MPRKVPGTSHSDPTRLQNGRFAKGFKQAGCRKKGIPNKVNRSVKEWLLQAAEAIGSDGRGKNGGAGFCEAVGREKGEALLTALLKLLPTSLEDGAPASGVNVTTINVVSVPSGTFLTKEQAEQLAMPQITVVDGDADVLDLEPIEADLDLLSAEPDPNINR